MSTWQVHQVQLPQAQGRTWNQFRMKSIFPLELYKNELKFNLLFQWGSVRVCLSSNVTHRDAWGQSPNSIATQMSSKQILTLPYILTTTSRNHRTDSTHMSSSHRAHLRTQRRSNVWRECKYHLIGSLRRKDRKMKARNLIRLGLESKVFREEIGRYHKYYRSHCHKQRP